MSRGTTGHGGVRTGCGNPEGAANCGRIGCGREKAPIDEVVAVRSRWKAGRKVVEKKVIIVSMSMNAAGKKSVSSKL